MSPAAQQFAEDFPDVYWSVPWFIKLGRYGRDFDDEEAVYWTMLGNGLTKREQYIPERYGGSSFCFYYDNEGSKIGQQWYNEPIEWLVQ